MQNTPAMELRHVTKIIKGKRIVDAVSFSVVKGEVLGLLGPNGAGKTTTMRMMVGLSAMSSGDVLIEGHSIKHAYSQAIAHIGAIIETPDQYLFLSGYHNLLHHANMMPTPVSRDRIMEVVDQVRLSERIHDKVGTYSLGMRQRLGLAQALLHQPSVLILDEPTNGLDPDGIHELRQHLRLLAKERNVAVLISSHQLAEMQLICDRVAIMQQGRLLDVYAVQPTHGSSSVKRAVRFSAGPLAEAKEWLADLYPDLSVEWHVDGFTVQLEHEEIPELVASLVGRGLRIYGVHPEEQSLETMYLQATKGGMAP